MLIKIKSIRPPSLVQLLVLKQAPRLTFLFKEETKLVEYPGSSTKGFFFNFF